MSKLRYKDEKGNRYGRLVAVSMCGYNATKQALWLCRCDCGTNTTVAGIYLRVGRIQSCGCLRYDRTATHGLHQHELYRTWYGMVQRCINPENKDYYRYGGRGITVCPRWEIGESELSGLECFIADIPDRPSKRHSIDRIDNNRGYEPGNVRWATGRQQNRNRRDNRIVCLNGRDVTVAEACEMSGVNYNTAQARLNRGWNIERAFGGRSS
ncbi:hypothetical protein [Aquamicrobium terrae]|uniref:HNH endonuclease n=1 Tax=Aquamicrobium terrae TaxID=1324945 RepID=A0ABV2MV53_9HYPH